MKKVIVIAVIAIALFNFRHDIQFEFERLFDESTSGVFTERGLEDIRPFESESGELSETQKYAKKYLKAHLDLSFDREAQIYMAGKVRNRGRRDLERVFVTVYSKEHEDAKMRKTKVPLQGIAARDDLRVNQPFDSPLGIEVERDGKVMLEFNYFFRIVVTDVRFDESGG